MTLGFNGSGGAYYVGKLTTIEVNNIAELLQRFDSSIFLGREETIFDTHDFKREYYDFDDVCHVEGVALNCGITIDNLPTDCKSNLVDSFISDKITVVEQKDKVLEDGFYIISYLEQRGNFFTVDIDVHPDEFNMDELMIYANDMDVYDLSDFIVESVWYGGIELNMDTDSYETDSEALHQSIIYVKDGKHYDGVEELNNRFPEKYDIIDFYQIDEPPNYILNYLEFIEAKNSGYLLNKGYPLAYVSPMLYNNFNRDEVDELWITEENIKYAFKYDMIDFVPQDIYDRIFSRFPEWLI